jgi:cytochrome c oxidase cbb3-type subunit 2
MERKIIMKKIMLICMIIIMLVAVYGYTMMRGSMMGMMQGTRGDEVEVDLSGPRPPENERTIAAGQRVYEQRCAVCHGLRGDGEGPRANDLYSRPRDFTRGLYKFRSTPTGSLPADEDIYSTISRGIRGTGMMPWYRLRKDDRWAVTYYLRTFSERFEEEDVGSSIEVPELNITGSEMISSGREIYEKAKCRECHGRLGNADGPKAAELKDEWGYLIRPRNFSHESFKRGPEINDIFLTIATGLDGSPMASYGDVMPYEDIAAMAAYVNFLSKLYPPRQRGMMGMTPDEHRGMMISSGMHGGMMGQGMMH